MIEQSDAEYWNSMVDDFDAIYSGDGRTAVGRALEKWLRRDVYQRLMATVQLIDEMGAHQRVLDVGCGTGRLCAPLSRRGHRVVGVDFSEEMLEEARRIVAEKGREDRCTFIRADIVNDMPPELGEYERFDVIVYLGLLEYMSDPVPMMQKLKRFEPAKMVGSFCRAGTLRSYLRRARYKIQGLDCPLYFHEREAVEAVATELDAEDLDIELMGQLWYSVFEF